MNSSFMDSFIRMHKQVNICIAVGTDICSKFPVIFNVNKKGLEQIAKESKDLAQKARDGKLTKQEL